VKYKYGDGKPAAVSFNRGSGRICIFAFVPGSAQVMQQIFRDTGIDSWTARSDDENASAWLLKSNNGYYTVAVNSENKSKTVHVRLQTGFDRQPVVYDMLTGEKVAAGLEPNGVVVLEAAMEPFWGRAFALLPAEPAGLSITPSSGNLKSGGATECRVSILDAGRKIIGARFPVEVKVTDASGRDRAEYGGYRIAENGELKLVIDTGTNDPAGEWKIEATQTWTGVKGKTVFKVD